MKRVFNLTSEKEKRRALRNNVPAIETALWFHLRKEQVAGLRFRRQFSVGAFVIDFYCAEPKLAIEIDGATHDGDDAKEYDANRQAWIEQYGVQFLRFTNWQVQHKIGHVLQIIETAATQMRNEKRQREIQSDLTL